MLLLVGFRHKSSQRPFLSLHRIKALLLQLRCIWDTSPLLCRPRQPLNGAVLIAEYPVSSPFHDGAERSQALYLGNVRVVGLLLSVPSFWLSNGLEECVLPQLRQTHHDGNVQSFMLLLNPAITQMRSVRTNFVLKRLVHADRHLGSPKEVFPGFAWLWPDFIN